DTDLIRLFSEVLKGRNCSVTDGHRDEATQNRYFNMTPQRSQLKYPESGHNKYPSLAADIIFYPFKKEDWNDRERFMEFRGFVYGVASQLNIKLKKTIPWDLPHYELAE
ncbi:unnamed protein product, partial [marine sediment metagenome]